LKKLWKNSSAVIQVTDSNYVDLIYNSTNEANDTRPWLLLFAKKKDYMS